VPDVRDCTPACRSSADCAQNQVCGSAKMCAAPEVAGMCSRRGVDDAGIPVDAELQLDAPIGTKVAIQVVIDGQGSVNIGGMTCMSTGQMDSAAGDCMLTTPLGMPAMAVAIAMGPNDFERWTSPTCANQGANCTFTPLRATTQLAVRFVKKP
jgi:hypothetical protein